MANGSIGSLQALETELAMALGTDNAISVGTNVAWPDVIWRSVKRGTLPSDKSD